MKIEADSLRTTRAPQTSKVAALTFPDPRSLTWYSDASGVGPPRHAPCAVKGMNCASAGARLVEGLTLSRNKSPPLVSAQCCRPTRGWQGRNQACAACAFSGNLSPTSDSWWLNECSSGLYRLRNTRLEEPFSFTTQNATTSPAQAQQRAACGVGACG